MGTTTQVTDFSDLVSIYGLIDSRTSELRYVGKAKDAVRRNYEHVCASHLRPRTHKNHWIKGLLKEGAKPELLILEEVSSEEWAEAESFWISYLKSIGCRLTNGTSGGDGLHDPDEVTRWKCGSSMRGKKLVFSEAHKAKIAAANRARAKDPAWREAISKRMKGNKNGAVPRSEETKKRISVAVKARFSAMSDYERCEFSRFGVAARRRNVRKKNCIRCFDEYSYTAHNAIYCSGKCKSAAFMDRKKANV